MLALLAKIGSLVGTSTCSLWWYFDEPKCPKSLIK